MNLGRLEAVAGIEQIVALIVRSAELASDERWLEALACLDEGAAINPWLPICQVNRARVLRELKRYEAALDDCDFFLRYATPLPEVVALRQDIFDEAKARWDQQLDRSPDDVAALFARGNLYLKTRLYASALADYAALLACDAGHVDALNNQGLVFSVLNRYAEAAASCRAAIAGAPQKASLWFNLGCVCQAQGDFDTARSAYREAIAREPELAEAHLEIAHCDLAQGDYRGGWRGFEWRWRTAQLQRYPRPSSAPLWLGAGRPAADETGLTGELAGKTLLVWAEQGAGDTLQFVRFVPQLLPLAGKVLLRVPPALCRLIERVDARIDVVGDDRPVPAHDFQCPLMSLPLALGVDAPPSAAPYLSADASAVSQWRGRLGESKALRVGLAWAGRQHGQTNLTRDLPLALLAPLAALGVDLFSLQKEIPATDLPALDVLPALRSFAGDLRDYADTAALIMNLDLVIAVDTSVAHLAGALGKPCWLLLRHSGEWRWLRERSDTPWYATLTLFRQQTQGDWAELVARVAAALAQRLAAGVWAGV